MKVVKLSIFLVIAIIIGSFIYFSYGTPWDRLSYKQHFNEYLVNKYNQPFEIEKLYFDMGHGQTYHAYAHPRENKDLVFYVGQNPSTKEVEDSFQSQTWQLQAEQELKPVVEKYYPDNINYAVTVYPIDSTILKESTVSNYKNYAAVEVGISMKDYEITDENREREIEKAYSLLMVLKEAGIQFQHFGISYQNQTIQLQPNEINSIRSAADLDRSLIDYR